MTVNRVFRLNLIQKIYEEDVRRSSHARYDIRFWVQYLSDSYKSTFLYTKKSELNTRIMYIHMPVIHPLALMIGKKAEKRWFLWSQDWLKCSHRIWLVVSQRFDGQKHMVMKNIERWKHPKEEMEAKRERSASLEDSVLACFWRMHESNDVHDLLWTCGRCQCYLYRLKCDRRMGKQFWHQISCDDVGTCHDVHQKEENGQTVLVFHMNMWSIISCVFRIVWPSTSIDWRFWCCDCCCCGCWCCCW